MTALDFKVKAASPVPFAAIPHLAFSLQISAETDQPVQAITLHTQIRIEPTRRSYTPAAQDRLFELFGEPSLWARSLHSLLWTHVDTMVPAFNGGATVDLIVPCSFDFNLAAAKYFSAVGEGEIPLSFLFSGSVFQQEAADGRLQITRIAWDRDADFRLPAQVWRDMMDAHYPDSVWLCVPRNVLRRLERYKRDEKLPTWERVFEHLLPAGEEGACMNTSSTPLVDRIAHTLLYEGFILYPYRPSVKNAQRWTFGGVYPRAYVAAQARPGVTTADNWFMQTQCLVRGPKSGKVAVTIRFLQLVDRRMGRFPTPVRPNRWPVTPPDFEPVDLLEVDGQRHRPWQEAVEREVRLDGISLDAPQIHGRPHSFVFPSQRTFEPVQSAADALVHGVIERRQQALAGHVDISQQPLTDDLFRLSVRVVNDTPLPDGLAQVREHAVLRSFASTHMILSSAGTDAVEFISLADPPESLRRQATECRNVGAWPVLIGEPPGGQFAPVMLASPIILGDFPQIAPESPGELFDATEIDEILTLRILTLTDEEKQEASAIDERTRALLERTETLARTQLACLHGTFREAEPAMQDPTPANAFSEHSHD